jgi:hypothetical protein
VPTQRRAVLADLLLPADDRGELPVSGALREVEPELVEGGRRCGRPGAPRDLPRPVSEIAASGGS